MTSVDLAELRLRRKLDLMLALGELVAVEDPETGETYYMITQALVDMVEGRCAAGSPSSQRPRHAKEGLKGGLRIRGAMVMIASGIALSAALPAAVTLAAKPGIHRVIDDDDSDGHYLGGLSAGRSVARGVGTRSTPTDLPSTSAGRSRPVRVLLTSVAWGGSHNSNTISNWGSRFTYGSLRDGAPSQVGEVRRGPSRQWDHSRGVTPRVRELARS
jgi:hypothetical protein